jgi:dipeptidyl aminopeptidase/acylaminoacyl peptidase
MRRMDALRARVRRPEPPIAAGISLVVTGLVAAIVLGNTLAAPGDFGPNPGVSQPPGSSASPAPTATATGNPTSSESPAQTLGAVLDSAGWKPVAWSPDGATLLLRRDEEWGVLDESARIESVDAESAAWWPGAGRTLSVIARDTDGQASLELRPLDGGEPRTVVRQSEITTIAWTPDGETVAVAGPTGVLAGSARGSLTQVATTAASAVTVSPDGAEVAYVVAAGADAGSLVLLDVGAKRARAVASVRMLARDALAWSPNGRFIALTQSASSQRGLYLLAPSVPQSPAFVLSDADPASVRWSSDGRFLAASHPAGSGSEVVSIRVRPDKARLETLGSGQVTAWSPDSQALLTVDSTGRLLAYPVGAEAESDASTSPPSPSPLVIATDADLTCVPAWSRLEAIAYCDSDAAIRLIRWAAP